MQGQEESGVGIATMVSVVVTVLERDDDDRVRPEVIGIYSGMLAADRALDELVEQGLLESDRDVWMYQVRHLRDGRMTFGTVRHTVASRDER